MQRQRGIDPKKVNRDALDWVFLDTIYPQVRLYEELTKGLYSLEPSAAQGCYSRIELASRRARRRCATGDTYVSSASAGASEPKESVPILGCHR